MTNLKKLGLSALAGSLVAVSAQAGEMAVTGSANVTLKTGNAANGLTNKSIGSDKDVSFTGSGELDNGWTFTVSTLMTDAFDVSSSYTSMTMGSLGTISTGTHTGGASYKYDEEVPQAYEQTSDAQQNTANLVGNQMDSGSLVYHSPSFDISGATLSFDAEYSPQADDSGANDGGTSTYSETFRTGYGLGATVKYADFTFGIYGNERENVTPIAAGNDSVRDSFEGVWYAKYSYGPVSVGYSESYLDSGVTGAAEAITAAKVARTAAGIFESESMSVAFNVNENLSLSYTTTEDTYDAQDNAATAIADTTQDSTAIQVAYSMGAMSVKAYQMETKNPGYDSDAPTENVTEIALGLAF
jgi:outer membrane protein OmpU